MEDCSVAKFFASAAAVTASNIVNNSQLRVWNGNKDYPLVGVLLSTGSEGHLHLRRGLLQAGRDHLLLSDILGLVGR